MLAVLGVDGVQTDPFDPVAATGGPVHPTPEHGNADKPRLSERERRARLISAARDYLTATQRLGVDTDQAIAALHKLLAWCVLQAGSGQRV